MFQQILSLFAGDSWQDLVLSAGNIFFCFTLIPALRFNVLSKPTEIARVGTAIKSGGPITETKKLQLEFWTLFRDQLLKRKVVTSAQTPQPRYWFNISLGRSHIHLSCIANTFDGRIGLRVYISNKIADQALPQLEAQRKEIEAEIGEALEWNPNPEKQDKIIMLDRAADLDDRSQWDECITWLVDHVDKFREGVRPAYQVAELDA